MDILFQWLIDRFQSLYIGFMVRPYERAVHIRRGHVLRVCRPGFYFKLPFEIDDIHKVNVVSTTLNLKAQSVITKDEASLVVGIVVRWRVREESVARLIVDLEDHEDVLRDTVYGMVAEQMAKLNWQGMDLPAVSKKVKAAASRRLGKFGFDIEAVYITDISEARAFRLVTGDGF